MKTDTITISVNKLGFVLKRDKDVLRWGTICWDYNSYIAFDLEKNEATVCVNDVKTTVKAVSVNPTQFVYSDGTMTLRWRVSDDAVLTLMLLEGNDVKATLVITANAHVGFEMTENLLQCLKKLNRKE